MKNYIVLVLLLAGSAFGQGLLDFNMDAIHAPNASISYAGGVAPLVGVNISVDSVTGIGTPANAGKNGVLACLGCTLNFTTGAFSGSSVNEWLFGPGGAISITGAIPDLGLPAGTEILFGGLMTATVHLVDGGMSKVVLSTFVDDKDPILEAYFGLGDTPTWNGTMNLSFWAQGLPPDAFNSYVVLSGDIVNSPIPEPGSIILLGTCLLAGVAAFRKHAARARG